MSSFCFLSINCSYVSFVRWAVRYVANFLDIRKCAHGIILFIQRQTKPCLTVGWTFPLTGYPYENLIFIGLSPYFIARCVSVFMNPPWWFYPFPLHTYNAEVLIIELANHAFKRLYSCILDAAVTRRAFSVYSHRLFSDMLSLWLWWYCRPLLAKAKQSLQSTHPNGHSTPYRVVIPNTWLGAQACMF